MIELVDYETYRKMTPEEKWLQRLQGLGEILEVTGWRVMTDEEIAALPNDNDEPEEVDIPYHAMREPPQTSYHPITRRISTEETEE